MFNLVLLLPALKAVLLKQNKKIGILTTSTITITFMILTFLTSCYVLYEVTLNNRGQTISYTLLLWMWFYLEPLSFGGFNDTLPAVLRCDLPFISLAANNDSLDFMKKLKLFSKIEKLVCKCVRNMGETSSQWEGWPACSLYYSQNLPKLSLGATKGFTFNNILENRGRLLHPKQNYSQEFLEWFVGFSESSPCVFKVSSGKSPRFVITHNDHTFLYTLQKTFGFGTVLKDATNPDNKRFYVRNPSKIKILINIFNGNLVLMETNQNFKLWVESYNKSTGDKVKVKTSITNTFMKNQLLLKSSWFCGFIEAKICFYVRCVGQETFNFRFVLKLKEERFFVESVKFCLGVSQFTLLNKKYTSEGTWWVFASEDLSVIACLVNYFSEQTFRTKKQQKMFSSWNQLYNLKNVVIENEKKKGTYVFSAKRATRI